jgi:hypothetical protein
VNGVKFTVKPSKIDIMIYRAAIRRLLALVPEQERPAAHDIIDVTAWVREE